MECTHEKVDLGRLKALRAQNEDDQCNRRLLHWLSCDSCRAALFRQVNADGGAFKFPSRDARPRECIGLGYDHPLADARPYHMDVVLVTGRAEIERMLRDDHNYSSRVYSELDGGSFMLALDPRFTPAHAAQRDAFRRCFPHDPGQLQAVAHAACEAAGVMAFKAQEFDLADFARQAALRFVQMLMGFSIKDFPLLDQCLDIAYRALVHQVFERHFVTDRYIIPSSQECTANLLTRTAALMHAYASHDHDALRGCKDPALPPGVTPVLKKLAELPGNLNGEQRAFVAVGSAIGSVGNVQAAACIAVKGLFSGPHADLARARELADPRFETSCCSCGSYRDWFNLIAPLLRANPPIPYLPRLLLNDKGDKTEEYLLALGGGTAKGSGHAVDDPLVWGLPDDAKHNCAGKSLAWPLVIEIVRKVMSLPELEQGLDPENGRVKGLKKRHGFACESYPFTYRRDRRRAQTTLNVRMRISAPVQENAMKLREVIVAGAPRIEHALRSSRHIHFAWFELIESDTVLVLHTVYDGPFGAYLQHFALVVGDLFDELFKFIEDPPPLPVSKFPTEFATHLQLYDHPPTMGYFFSAYPCLEVAAILRNENCKP